MTLFKKLPEQCVRAINKEIYHARVKILHYFVNKISISRKVIVLRLFMYKELLHIAQTYRHKLS